jgi:hypothetical protein
LTSGCHRFIIQLLPQPTYRAHDRRPISTNLSKANIAPGPPGLRPTWLTLAQQTLVAAVFAAYGWPTTLSDDQILERLLERNLPRAKWPPARPFPYLGHWILSVGYFAFSFPS